MNRAFEPPRACGPGRREPRANLPASASTPLPCDRIANEAAGHVLVTGANGFLGEAVAAAIARSGRRVLRGARAIPVAPASGEAWVGYGDIGPATRWQAMLAG